MTASRPSGGAAAIRVVLVDDQAMIRSGLRLLLESEGDIAVVGEAASGAEAMDVVHWERPDVVLMDVQMPGIDGLEATRRLIAGPTPPRVLVLTTFDLDEYLFGALRAGASGFLLKNAPGDELIDAVRVVARGDALLSPTVTGRVIATFAGRRVDPAAAHRLASLTDRERDVLRLVARGLSNAEVADRLTVGESTVKTHLSSVFAKLGLRDRVEAVIFAYESGLIERGIEAS